jgi:hypothetical protein
MLQRCFPSGVNSDPHGYVCCANPPRAANSHSASVGNRFPAHAAYAAASFHDTCVTGISIRAAIDESGPSGRSHFANGTLHHHGTANTVSSTNFLYRSGSRCP